MIQELVEAPVAASNIVVPLFFAALLQFIEVRGFSFMHNCVKVPPQDLNVGFDRLTAAPPFFSFSALLL